MNYSFTLGDRMISKYAPLVDAAMEIKLEATTAHLWLEEILSGDHLEGIASVRQHLSSSQWYATAMLEGGENPEGIFTPVTDPALRSEIEDVITKIIRFREITEERFESESEFGAGSDIDQRYDALFNEFVNQADRIESKLQATISNERQLFKITQLILTVTSLIMIAFMAWVFSRHDYRLSLNAHEAKKAKEQIQRLALYDTLTGLGNRNLFMRQIEHLIAIAERRNEEVALLEMDLDGFKDVNDRLGHAAGDEVLREFGVRLGRVLRKGDQKYRIGGDEFAVLLEPRIGAFDLAVVVAEKIAEHVAVPMQIKGHYCSIGVSIGIAVFPDHGREANALLRKADAAMYEAKKKHQVVAGASEHSATTVLERLRSEN